MQILVEWIVRTFSLGVGCNSERPARTGKWLRVLQQRLVIARMTYPVGTERLIGTYLP